MMMTVEALKALLEVECPRCKGKIREEMAEFKAKHGFDCHPCDECLTRGTVLSDVGKYLIGLIAHELDFHVEGGAYGANDSISYKGSLVGYIQAITEISPRVDDWKR